MSQPHPGPTRAELWRAFWEAGGRLLEHRRVDHTPPLTGEPCDHKQQREADAAADAYLASGRTTTDALPLQPRRPRPR